MSFPRLLDLLYRGLGLARHAAQDEPLPSFGSPTRLEWLSIISLAEKNGVSGLAYDAMRTLPPDQRPDTEVIMQWTALIQSTERDNLLFRQRASAVFSHLGIPAKALSVVMVADAISKFFSSALNQAMLQSELVLQADKEGMLNTDILRR